MRRGALLYAEGSCWPNPGPGGWAVVAVCGTRYRELHGGKTTTTNCEMELMAIFKALCFATRRWKIDSFILVASSQYATECVSTWYRKWEHNGWMTVNGDHAVKHKELIQAITALVAEHHLTGQYRWVDRRNAGRRQRRAAQLAARHG